MVETDNQAIRPSKQQALTEIMNAVARAMRRSAGERLSGDRFKDVGRDPSREQWREFIFDFELTDDESVRRLLVDLEIVMERSIASVFEGRTIRLLPIPCLHDQLEQTLYPAIVSFDDGVVAVRGRFERSPERGPLRVCVDYIAQAID